VKKIAEALRIPHGGTVIEIGPGHGELTRTLLEACRAAQCRIIVIEKDERLAQELSIWAEQEEGAVIVREGDALKLLPEIAAGASGAPYVIAGNIPYYITGKLLRTVGDLSPKPARTIFMVQREVAERASAQAPRMNRLAANVQRWAEAAVIGSVPKTDFSPPPEVDSALLLLSTIPGEENRNDPAYERAARAIFAQPRKTIANNILHASSLPRAEIEKRLKAEGIDPESRPQNLTIADVRNISRGEFGIE